MNYKVTTQYARGEERMVAEFYVSQDAMRFLDKKISVDMLQGKKKIYRLYGRAKLLREFNPESISVTYAQYAEADFDCITPITFLFDITIQTQNSLEKQNIAHFNDLNDAYVFIVEKCKTDSTVKDNDFFSIFKDRVLIKTLNKAIIVNQNLVSEEGTNDEPSMAIFNPTPMPRRPTPPGGPSDCWREPEDDDNP